MDEEILIEEQRKLYLIIKWLAETTEPFDDWDYDGEVLIILFEDEVIERYTKEEMTHFIKGFV